MNHVERDDRHPLGDPQTNGGTVVDEKIEESKNHGGLF
jgi:hypothetical protein